ncbi:MAG: hypothetical protein E7626_05465 [Ruminococcaceae bacterium]|nr:hypothetical protein [Oscillospiraceae bacterium]
MKEFEVEREEKYVDPDEIKRPTSFLKWIENFWYHYKWHTIIGLFFVILAIVLVVQLVQREKYDIKIAYAGDFTVMSEDENATLLSDFPEAMEKISKAFESFISDDINNDKKKNAITHGEYLLSPEREAELRKQAQDKSIETNQQWAFNYSANDRSTATENVGVLLSTGEAIICLMDTYSYKTFGSDGAFARLEDVLGYLPDSAIDECAVLLSNTAFGEYFKQSFEGLPEDTVLCIRKKATVGVGRDFDEIYAAHIDVFKRVIGFTY